MDILLCNEVWLQKANVRVSSKINLDSSICKEDYEQAFRIFVAKEARFSPKIGYSKMIQSDDLIRRGRCKAVNWIVKTQRRMDLSVETGFMAVNYLDRFMSMNQCEGWKCWMFELLSISCLSVAAKFNETTPHPLYEFEAENAENSFDPGLKQRMELKLLEALDWRVDCTTPFSYIDLMTESFRNLDNTVIEDFSSRVTELLISALLDAEFVEFPQCTMAMSAVRCVLEENLFPSFFVIPPEHKNDLIKCQTMMEKLLSQDHNILDRWHGPSSPITVLFYDFSPVDSGRTKKRKREELELN